MVNAASNLQPLTSFLDEAAAANPNEPAFTFLFDGKGAHPILSWRALQQGARSIAAQLTARGLASQRVLLVFRPGLDFIQTFFACLYANVVAVPIYPPKPALSNALFFGVYDDLQPSAILTEPGFELLLKALLLPRSLSKNGCKVLALKAHESLLCADSSTNLRRTALIQYTSGSTSSPRGVVISEQNLLENLAIIHGGVEQSQSSVGIHWLPMYHDMGLMNMLYAVYRQFHCVLLSPMDVVRKPIAWLQAISTYRATYSGGPPFGYLLAEKKITEPELESLDLASWELAYVGAEKIQPETLRNFARKFSACGFRPQALYPCYGLAEHTVAVCGGKKSDNWVEGVFSGDSLDGGIGSKVESYDPTRDTRKVELVGCGTSQPGHQILIVDPESGRCLPDSTIGEIWPVGPSIAQGYWRKEDLSKSCFRCYTSDGKGPCLRTGDLGFLIGGELFVAGRIKDLVILKGRNVCPEDLELTLSRAHPQCRPGCAAAFSVEQEDCEGLVVFQEIRNKAGELPAICQAIRALVAKEHQAAIASLVLLKEGYLPKTSSGKVQRSQCRKLFLQDKIPGRLYLDSAPSA